MAEAVRERGHRDARSHAQLDGECRVHRGSDVTHTPCSLHPHRSGEPQSQPGHCRRDVCWEAIHRWTAVASNSLRSERLILANFIETRDGEPFAGHSQVRGPRQQEPPAQQAPRALCWVCLCTAAAASPLDTRCHQWEGDQCPVSTWHPLQGHASRVNTVPAA